MSTTKVLLWSTVIGGAALFWLNSRRSVKGQTTFAVDPYADLRKRGQVSDDGLCIKPYTGPYAGGWHPTGINIDCDTKTGKGRRL